MKTIHLLSALLVVPQVLAPVVVPAVRAQNAPAKSPSTPEAPKEVPILQGEIRLDGRITAMTGASEFDIKAFSFTTPAGKTIEFDEARDKSIAGSAETKVFAGDDVQKSLGWKVVKLGMRVVVIGKDSGSGKPLRARAIVLSDFSSKYVKGRSVSVSAPVSILLRRAETFFEGRDFERALTLYRQAVGVAAGGRDAAGAALALSLTGRTYKELGQTEKAIQSYEEALKARQGAEGKDTTIQNNLALIYMEVGRSADAVRLLEAANQNASEEGEEVQLVMKSNLGRALLGSKQWERAGEIFRGLAGAFKARGESEREVFSLLASAEALREQGKAEEAASLFNQARTSAEAATESSRKAASLLQIGVYLSETGDKPAARENINKAIAIFEQSGDARSVQSAQLALQKIDAPETRAAPVAAAQTPAEVPAEAPVDATPPAGAE